MTSHSTVQPSLSGQRSLEPTVLEVALNGPWGRERQPRMPISVREIVNEAVQCAEAGASVVHVHPYDEKTGRQCDELDLYLRIIEGVRERSNVPVVPTAPFVNDGDLTRYSVSEELARRGLIEWAAIDPGSCNIARFDDIKAGRPGFVYRNEEESVDAALSMAQRHAITAAYACYEPGFVRLGAALHARYPRAPYPLYRLMFSDQFTFGFPPEIQAMDAYQWQLERYAPQAPVMVAGLGVNVMPLIPSAVQRGWHVRVGLEDAHFGCPHSNLELTRQAIRAIEATGARVATFAEARMLGRTSGAFAAQVPAEVA